MKEPYTQRRIISDLSKRDDVILLDQDKGRGVVVMGRSKYAGKCLEMLSTKQFTVVEIDPNKTLESKIQRISTKLKSKITDQEYKDLYPTGSQPRKFYDSEKMHKLPDNGNLNYLPLRPIVSNINTSTHNLVKFLPNLLSPLRQSDHKVRSIKDFIQFLKWRIYQMATRWYCSM